MNIFFIVDKDHKLSSRDGNDTQLFYTKSNNTTVGDSQKEIDGGVKIPFLSKSNRGYSAGDIYSKSLYPSSFNHTNTSARRTQLRRHDSVGYSPDSSLILNKPSKSLIKPWP